MTRDHEPGALVKALIDVGDASPDYVSDQDGDALTFGALEVADDDYFTVKMAKTPNVSVGKLHVFVDTQDNIMLDKSRDQLSTGRQQGKVTSRTTTSRTTTTETTTTKTKTCSETVFDIKPFWWWIRLIFGSSYRIVFRVSKQVIMGEDTVEIQVQLPESSLKHVEVLARNVADNKFDLVFRINKKFLGTHRHELVIHSLPTTVEEWERQEGFLSFPKDEGQE